MKTGNKTSNIQLKLSLLENQGNTNVEDIPPKSTQKNETLHSEVIVISMREKLLQLEKKREREIIEYILLNSKRF